MVQLRPPLHFGSIELDLGMNNENEENPYVCSEIGCGQAFKSSRDLINHRVNHVVVENAQGWICPFESCAQGDFADLIDANIHMYRTHNEDIEAAQCRIDRAKKLDEVTDNYNDNSDVEGVWKADSLGRVIYTTRVSFYQNVSNFSVGDIKYGFHTAAGVYS
ncbi:hypothetical protein GQ42DRAFT_159184 [Ramicandelaber brevisporus]|nr:hypothetical protein GQ42DRAFT_159184 [Ramicandelaber brevisporus]